MKKTASTPPPAPPPRRTLTLRTGVTAGVAGVTPAQKSIIGGFALR